MEFRIPILSQEAYSDTQHESTLEDFEELRPNVSLTSALQKKTSRRRKNGSKPPYLFQEKEKANLLPPQAIISGVFGMRRSETATGGESY